VISFNEAAALVEAAAAPLGTEKIDLAAAAGRVLAQAVHARVDSPRCDVSAMDGYAVRNADLHALPVSLSIVGESFAGSPCDRSVGAGECVRIFTGAAVPDGADRVVIQENVRRESDTAIIDEAPGHARHIRQRGGDFEEGDLLLACGQLLHPRAIVAAAGADMPQLEVFKKPRVSILSTGDELVDPGTAATTAGAIPESVSFGVAALAEQWGGCVVGRSRLLDSLAEMEAAAAQAITDADLVVVTGGASVGEKDFAKQMFEPAGLQLVFSKVAIKPGKPVWLGRTGDTLVLGLPGNPTSALVTARLFLAPLLCGLTGRKPGDALQWRSAKLATDVDKCGVRETFQRAWWSNGKVDVLSNQDSSAQRALAHADLLVRQRPNSPKRTAADEVEVLDF
jgi:molybdopterin molybdotransferase